MNEAGCDPPGGKAEVKRFSGLYARLAGWLCLALMFSVAGCALPPEEYAFGRPYRPELRPALDRTRAQVERGRPCWLPDKLGHYLFSIPRKLVLFNTRIGNHRITVEQEELIRRFLTENDMRGVKVRLNQYAPIGEFKRLWRNSDVGVAYRATFGVLWWGYSALIPGRLFAGSFFIRDHYNPYTNTIHVYSGHPAMLIQTCAIAKDYSQRRRKGTRAFCCQFPFVDLHEDGCANGDAIRYLHSLDATDDTANAYRLLYPNFGSALGRNLTFFVGHIVQNAVTVVLVIPGHIAGRVQARKYLEFQKAAGAGATAPKGKGPPEPAEAKTAADKPEAEQPAEKAKKKEAAATTEK